VGTAGKLGGSANVKHARGEWHNLVTGLNRMVDRVTGQVRAISRSTVSHDQLAELDQLLSADPAAFVWVPSFVCRLLSLKET
jgi:hypothetical protein